MNFRPDILWFRTQGSLKRWWYKVRNLRPSSGPFPSGDGFRALAHHVWDECNTPAFQVSDVNPYDIIFVSWHVWPFLTEIGPLIRVPFFLVTSNSDSSPDEAAVAAFRKTSGVHWWAASLTVPNSRYATVIPLGLQNERFCWYGDTADFRRLKKKRRPGSLPLICWGFAVENNPQIRGPIREALQRNPKAVELTNLDPYSYRRQLVKYQYVACPAGNGQDSHRLWEALALGVVPVLLRSQHVLNLLDQGLIPTAVILPRIDDFATFLNDEGSASR